MPRSSRNKSSKHASRDAREYSDSEDDLEVKERKGRKEEEEGSGSVRVSKYSVLSEKRKLDGKEGRRDGYDGGSGDGENYSSSSSKRRKGRESGDGVSDRWNGGGEYAEEKGDGSWKTRGQGDLKSSRRRDDGIEEMKKSGGRSEKHGKESSRKEGKEKERERDGERERERERDRYKERGRERNKDRERERGSERKGKEGQGEKFMDDEDEKLSSKREIAADSKADLHAWNSDPDDIPEKQNRKRIENPADKYQDETGDTKRKNATPGDDVMKDRRKNEKRRDEKYRDRYRDETERSRQDKYKDDNPVKDRSRSRSREKYSRDDKDHTDVRQKKVKPRHVHQENDFASSYDHRRRDREHERDVDHEHDGYRKRDQVSGRDRDRNVDKERERDHDYDRERERDYEHDQEPDRGHYDERSSKDEDRRGRRTSPDEQDEYGDSKASVGNALNSDLEKVSLNSSRIEAGDGGNGSHSRSANVDISPSNRRRISPTSSSYVDDRYRKTRTEDLKYMDVQMESRVKSNSTEATERSLKHRSLEKHYRTDDGMELTGERPASSKQSPMGLTDGSPSPSLDRRQRRSGAQRSLDVEDAGQRRGASADSRDVSVSEGKSSRDVGVDKPTVEESSQAVSSFSYRQAQGNMNPLPPPFRPGVESPSFTGMMEEDGRPNSNSRYKRTGDPSMGRGHMNSWRGMPNWPSPLPNGLMPFQSGLPHGNFQPIMPHFPSPPLFGFRPPIEINHPGMPFPLADPDRFPGHLRPLGWPNMIDPMGPRLHGWDVNNGILRSESHVFGAEWDHNRHPINAREWESSVDMWKGHNGNFSDLSAANNKDSTQSQSKPEDDFARHGNWKSYNENCHEGSEQKCSETRTVLTPRDKMSTVSAEGPFDRKKVSTKVEAVDNALRISQFYLSKLDISEELAHSEVYKQYVNLRGGKTGLRTDNGLSAHMVLMSDRIGISKASDDSLSSYVLPTTNDSIFQKAWDLYKNQRLEMKDVSMVKVDPLDSILKTRSDDVNKGDAARTRNEEKQRDMGGNEGLQSTLTTDPSEIVGDVKTVKDDTIGESGVESAISNNASPQNVRESEVEKWGESQTVPVSHAASPDSYSAIAVRPMETDTSGKVGSDSIVGSGHDPTEACEVASDESELVNYGRIHLHSPESTH
ncbi:hypothetical protein MLD38_030438 [Melastoma candidum]|uniref:Uncharacterized protein n=1 Tax=Melastoma candidum TaxID=119954 RepID=A0ACB9ML69_9MYRT|nr:hypothetical protein MLD38_030438 [Melastoma candidum]